MLFQRRVLLIRVQGDHKPYTGKNFIQCCHWLLTGVSYMDEDKPTLRKKLILEQGEKQASQKGAGLVGVALKGNSEALGRGLGIPVEPQLPAIGHPFHPDTSGCWPELSKAKDRLCSMPVK